MIVQYTNFVFAEFGCRRLCRFVKIINFSLESFSSLYAYNEYALLFYDESF